VFSLRNHAWVAVSKNDMNCPRLAWRWSPGDSINDCALQSFQNSAGYLVKRVPINETCAYFHLSMKHGFPYDILMSWDAAGTQRGLMWCAGTIRTGVKFDGSSSFMSETYL